MKSPHKSGFNSNDANQLVSLTGLSHKPKDKLITKVKHIPNYYTYILIHLFYKGPQTLRQIAVLVNRPDSNTRLSLIRMQELGMLIRESNGRYILTDTGRNEVEALRSMFFQ